MDKYTLCTEDFSLDNQELLLGETLFHNANGYLGVRGCFEEGYPQGFSQVRGTYINGFYDFAYMGGGEADDLKRGGHPDHHPEAGRGKFQHV